jgi:LuxR family maltose regulon positive regulatory protein
MISSQEQAVAAVPLLETKRYIPNWWSGQLSRPRLVERLDQGAERKLTLISAPAGFGKTTLLAEWLAATPHREQSAGWVSLDQGDNDPALFWAYVITALQGLRAGVGESALSLLQSPQSPPIESILTALINDLSASEDNLVLILDDYHVIDAQAIHSGVTFLLDHLPPQMHLVIASRSDPPLPLARQRARGELTELRAADLRFTPDEAAAFLNQVMRLDLSSTDIAALETRTEGWIAALQLAALSIRGQANVSGFIAAFAGDDRYIVDYLAEEVLQRQTEQVRSFLLQSSILDRLSAPLCDAVTGRNDGKRTLETLERGNLFLVPLDDKRHWYRYHHLFADVLQAHLRDELPDLVSVLHGRASEWYEQNGLPTDAIRHAVAAGEYARAADLVELTEPAMRRSRQEATLLGWHKMLPDELFHARPVLSVGHAFALLSNGELEGVEGWLQNAERWLDSPGEATGMVVVDDEVFRRLPGMISIARAGLTLAHGDLAGAAGHASRALDLVPADDFFWRGAASALLGLVEWTNGRLEAAYRLYADGMAFLQQAGAISDAIGGSTVLADIRIVQGRLGEAMRVYERGLQLAVQHGAPAMRGTADMHVGMSELYLERDDLPSATRHLLKSREQGEHTGFPRHPYRWRVAMARIQMAEGDHEGALDLLDEAQSVYVSDFHPDVRPVAAWKARVWVARGKLQEALGWANERGLSVESDLSYLREFEHVTLARMLLAQYLQDRTAVAIRQATALLERLRNAAEAGNRTGSVIEILVVQALAFAAQGNTSRALVPLERALSLAEPEGYVRLFTGEGEAMRDLLRHAAARAVGTAYTRRLLSAFDTSAPPTSAPVQAAAAALAEPLTKREIEVLRLIAAGLRNEEIAGQLFISLSTVKRHIANTYGKLGVSHRTQAIARANELDLL